MVEIRVSVPCNNTLGEGPVWDAGEQRLYWIDSMAGEIWRCRADGSNISKWTLPAEIGSLALRQQGGAVVALATGLHFFDFTTSTLTFIAHPEDGKEGVRLNDGKVDAGGRFVVGSLDMKHGLDQEHPDDWRGTLYRLDPDLTLSRLHDRISISNGPCWSPDGRIFYFTDSMAGTIYAHDWNVATGEPAGRRVFATIPASETLPDGATVDADGNLWSAGNGAWSGRGVLRCYAPDGALRREIELPTARPTSLMFGGPDLDILYVTTMNLEARAAASPYDGKLLSVHGTGARGIAERRFAG